MGRYVVDKAKELVELGRSNKILAIPTAIERVNKFVYGTRQGCQYLYGGETGTGKTTYVREQHIHIPYEAYRVINDSAKLDVLFADFSLEVAGELNILSGVTRRLFLNHGKVIPVDKLTNWNTEGGKLSDEDYKLVQQQFDYFYDFSDKLMTYDDEVTPTLYHDALLEIARKNGKFTKEGRWISECGTYTPNNPNLYVIVVIDTINLADTDSGHEAVKTSIDRISRISVWFRNKCNFTPIIIQQFSADISSTDRSRFGITTPLLRDFEDSRRTTKDANVVFGLYDPRVHMKDDQSIFSGYDISRLSSWFRSLHLLKNRNGRASQFIPLKFDGEIGVFTQLPPATFMGELEYELATRH